MPRRGSSSWVESARAVAALVGVAVVGVASVIALVAVAFGAPVAAESPTEVADALAVDGVFVAPGRNDVDEAALIESIKQARARGLRLVVSAPNQPEPDAEAFARRVLEVSDADASIVFPTEGGFEIHVIEEFEAASFRAQSAARSKADPAGAVAAFTEELLAEPERSLPPIVGQLVTAVILLAVLLAAVVALEQVLRRTIRPMPVVPPQGPPVESRQPGSDLAD